MFGGPYITNAAQFLIATLFGLYILAVMLRVLLQLVRADFFNPVSQFLVKVTNPPLRPLQRVIPDWRRLDVAALLLLILLQATELALLAGLDPRPVAIPAVPGLLVLSLAELLRLLLNIFFFTILIQVVLSWISPGQYNPAVHLLEQLNEPVMQPARRMLPPMGGLDLSPIVVLIALQLARILLVQPLTDLGYQLAR